MPRPNHQLECVSFNAFAFEGLITEACGGEHDSEQVKYLAAYLGNSGLGVQTLVVERPYIDRHFMEEFNNYYASSFHPPRASTTRVHALSSEMSTDELIGLVKVAAQGPKQRADVGSTLQDAYRGFMVVRPLPSAPIGRTVLATYTDQDARCFRTLQTSKVHLFGFELTVEGVPFQQQDGAIGVCATTAAWSALASVARATGHRGPTPFSVTRAATRHILNDRQIPAQAGLDLQQLLSAIRECGFAPYVMKASGNSQFAHSLKCYLASGIPVVLLLHEPGAGYHAVTAVGYRSPDSLHAVDDIVFEDGPAPIATTGFTRLYVHEDRLGPYARMAWLATDEDSDLPGLEHIKFRGSRYAYGAEPMHIHSGIAPLYPKLRLTPSGLLKIVEDTLPMMRFIVGAEHRDRLKVDLRFVLSGDYLRELLELGVDDPERILPFITSMSLPRYVGVVRFFVGNDAVGDILCDTTDIYRERPKYGSILALVPFVSTCEEPFQKFAEARLVHS